MWLYILIIAALDASLVTLGFFLGRALGNFKSYEDEIYNDTIDITEIISVIDGVKYTTKTTTYIEETEEEDWLLFVCYYYI